MGRKPKRANDEPSETLKLRHFIMNLIYRHGQNSIMIPSSRQLAASFGVARSTVQLALEQMVKDGFLFGKPGIGTFTNPARAFTFSGEEPPPLIGLLWGDGRNFFYDHCTCCQLAALGTRLTENGWNIRNVQLAASSEKDLIPELLDLHVDGLVWCYPRPEYAKELEKLSKQLPLVTVSLPMFEFNVAGVSSDFKTVGRQLGKELSEKGRRRLFFAVSGVKLISCLDAVRDPVFKFDEKVVSGAPIAFDDELGKAISEFAPDALFVNGRQAKAALALLRKERIENCLVVALQDIAGCQEFSGILLEENLDLMAVEATSIMRNLLASGTAERRKVAASIKRLPLKG